MGTHFIKRTKSQNNQAKEARQKKKERTRRQAILVPSDTTTNPTNKNWGTKPNFVKVGPNLIEELKLLMSLVMDKVLER